MARYFLVLERTDEPCTCLLDERGQASIEAAALLPTLLLALALLIQPLCALFTKGCMYSAASEGLRLSATERAANREENVQALVLRRLASVPQIPLFHSGDPRAWEIVLEDGELTKITVRGRVRLLPLIGVSALMLGTKESGELLLEVSVKQQTRPSWLHDDYESWVSVWND